jgi:hypothetical protein
MRLDVASICRQALASAAAEAELDAAIRRACRELYGQGGQDVSPTVQGIVSDYAGYSGLSRLEAAQRLAGSNAILDVAIDVAPGALSLEAAAQGLKSVTVRKEAVYKSVGAGTWVSEDGTPLPEEVAKWLDAEAQKALKASEPGKPSFYERVDVHARPVKDGRPVPADLAELLKGESGQTIPSGTPVKGPGGVAVRAWVWLLAFLVLAFLGCLTVILATRR